MRGAGGVFQVGYLGVINFAAAASSGSGTTSVQYSAGAQHIGRKFSLGASAIIAGRNLPRHRGHERRCCSTETAQRQHRVCS